VLKKFLGDIQKIREAGQTEFQAKIDEFDDDLAKEIDWHSIAHVGTFYKNRSLRKTSTGRFIFVPTLLSILFPALFVGIGCWVIYQFTFFKYLGFSLMGLLLHPINYIRGYFYMVQQVSEPYMILTALFGLAFALPGVIFLYFAVLPIVFDRHQRVFYKGFSLLGRKQIRIDDIHAIQIVSSLSDNYVSYELNLVLNNKERVNVIAHPKKEIIKNDAATVAQYLSIPVWDIE
jgi:hypothetical protein